MLEKVRRSQAKRVDLAPRPVVTARPTPRAEQTSAQKLAQAVVLLERAAAQATALRARREMFVGACVPDRPARKPRRRKPLRSAEQPEAMRKRVTARRRRQAKWRARQALACVG